MSVRRRGYLYLYNRLLDKWNRRYFTLVGTTLSYRTSRTDEDSFIAELDIRDATVTTDISRLAESSRRDFAISIHPKGQPHPTIVASRLQDDYEAWKRILSNPSASRSPSDPPGDDQDMGEDKIAQKGKPLPFVAPKAKAPESSTEETKSGGLDLSLNPGMNGNHSSNGHNNNNPGRGRRNQDRNDSPDGTRTPSLCRSVSNVSTTLIQHDVKPYHEAMSEQGPAKFDKVTLLMMVNESSKKWVKQYACLSMKRRTIFFFSDEKSKRLYETKGKDSFTCRFELHGGFVVPGEPLEDYRQVFEIFTPTHSCYLTSLPKPDSKASTSIAATPLADFPTSMSSVEATAVQALDHGIDQHDLEDFLLAIHTAGCGLRSPDRKHLHESVLKCMVMLGKHGELEYRTSSRKYKQVYARTIENAVGAYVLACYTSMLTQQLVTTVMLLHPGGEAAYEALTNWLPVDDDMKSLVGDVRPQGNEATAPSWHRRGVKVVAGLPQDDKDNEKKTTDAMGKKVDYSDLCFSIIEPPLTGSLVGINVDADSVGETQVRVFKCTSQRQRNEWVSVLSSIASDEFCSIPNDPSVRGPDHYATLKISSNASPSAIADAYKQLAKLYHPDKNPDPSADVEFNRITEAYDILSDPLLKQNYDVLHRDLVASRSGLRHLVRHARPELAHCDYKGAVSTPQMGPKIASSLLGINEAPLKLVHSPEPPKKQVTGPSPAEVEALKRALELEQQNRALERELQRKKQEEDEAKRKREAEEKQRREREREVEEKKQRAIEFEKKRRAAMDPVDRPLDDTVLQLLSKLSSGLRATKVSNNWMQSQRDVVLAVCKRPLPKDDGALFYCLEWDSKKRADYDRLFICHGVTVTTTVKSLPKELNPRKDYAFTITPDEEQVFGWQPVTFVLQNETDLHNILSVIGALQASTLKASATRPTVKGPRKYLDIPPDL